MLLLIVIWFIVFVMGFFAGYGILSFLNDMKKVRQGRKEIAEMERDAEEAWAELREAEKLWLEKHNGN